MNMKRFTGRTAREALALVRQAFGKDAVVMSTRPCPEGVEVLAMAPESLQQLEKLSAPTVGASTRSVAPDGIDGRVDASVDQDVEQLAMSTLSFQDYVRERMLKRRRSELASQDDEGHDAEAPRPTVAALIAAATPARAPQRTAAARGPVPDASDPMPAQAPRAAQPTAPRTAPSQAERLAARAAADSMFHHELHDDDTAPLRTPRGTAALRSPRATPEAQPAPAAASAPIDLQHDQQEMLRELRSVRGLIEQRFGALAFMERLQRQPRQALLSHKLLECGFSPALVRKLVDGLPGDGDETDWAASVLQRNLLTGEADAPLEDQGGVYALIGPTGVGKTTSTAKLAAAFAARHGAGNLGLITLDAYRVAAHEQLRAYGRILGVPVHTAHDRASLDDLLELLSAKKMVLIDTAGMAQRDTRTKELLDMLSHRSVNRLLVVNAASQGETVEDVLAAYRASTCRGVILSKIDEAMKLGPALDALIRHKVKVLAVANGQRVPEDWHRLSASALVQRALRCGGSKAWKLDSNDVNLVFAAEPATGAALLPTRAASLPLAGLAQGA
jgi:flagellar biosynthesis protein FlhF